MPLTPDVTNLLAIFDPPTSPILLIGYEFPPTYSVFGVEPNLFSQTTANFTAVISIPTVMVLSKVNFIMLSITESFC